MTRTLDFLLVRELFIKLYISTDVLARVSSAEGLDPEP